MQRRTFLSAAASLTALVDRAFSAEKKPARSPFLEGNFAPIREEVTADNLKVIGKLPPELNGLYVRNGPNPQFEPKGPYHWFDGDGMLHGLRLQDGKASYRNRYIQTAGWREENKAGKSLYGGLMGFPDLQRIARGEEGFKNAANTALVWYNGKLLALWEGGAPHAVDVPALKTSGKFTFGGKLKHAFTAHPKIDPATGEMMFFGYGPFAPYLQYSVADARGMIVRTTPIELPRAVMMHDFAITARHTLFLDLPATFDFTALFQGKSPMGFEPKHGARIGVLPRHGKGTDIKWFAIPPCYVFHTLNAWDDGDAVVLLACRMKALPAELNATPLQGLPEEGSSRLHRWRLDLKTGKVKEEALDDVASDFPRFDDRLMGKKTRFGYTMKLSMDGYVKYDLEKGSADRHELGKGRFGGEVVFVPRSGAKSEDDGWLLTYVHDQTTNKSEFVVFDAREFRKPPLARVLLPQRVPYGFHGTWLGEGLLAKT